MTHRTISADVAAKECFEDPEFVAAYEALAEEFALIEAAITRGLADKEAGRVTPHDEVMAEVDGIIDVADRRAPRR